MHAPRWIRLLAPAAALLAADLDPARAAEPAAAVAGAWEILEVTGVPHKRHECAFVAAGDIMYLLGGRRIQPVSRFDPRTRTWSEGAPPPVELHHFQPVVWQGRIFLAGAMTGRFPRETGLPNVLIYDPTTDSWETGPEIPADRRRGGAGSVVVGDTLYLVCGIVDGHWGGHVTWLDALDLRTGVWTRLPDAPRARDHFQAVVIDGKIHAVGGRRSSAETRETFQHVEAAVDVYDLARGAWSTLEASPLPTPRAGTSTLAWGERLLVAGGETFERPTAHPEVEMLDLRTGVWSRLPDLARGRHGTGLILWEGALYTASGSGNRGGAPELESIERLELPVD